MFCERCSENSIEMGEIVSIMMEDDCDSALLPNCAECKNYLKKMGMKNTAVLLVLKDVLTPKRRYVCLITNY